MENLVSFLISKLGTVLSKELLVFLISLMPVLELRGGLLAASVLRLNYPLALLLCIAGNLLPIPLVLLFIERFVNFLERFPISQKLALWFRRKVEKKRASIERYDFWGLVLFVGIPLPGTGAWTGALAAGILSEQEAQELVDHIVLKFRMVKFARIPRMKRKKAFLAIFCGVMLASLIMSLLSYGLLGAILNAAS